MGIEIDFVVRGVDIDLDVVFGPKMVWFSCIDQN